MLKGMHSGNFQLWRSFEPRQGGIYVRMSAEDFRIFELFVDRVRALEPEARIWAFGSRVRGDHSWASDLDICVVLPGEIALACRNAISDVACDVGYEHDRLIIPVVLSEEQFERGPMSASPLVKNILREGIAA